MQAQLPPQPRPPPLPWRSSCLARRARRGPPARRGLPAWAAARHRRSWVLCRRRQVAGATVRWWRGAAARSRLCGSCVWPLSHSHTPSRLGAASPCFLPCLPQLYSPLALGLGGLRAGRRQLGHCCHRIFEEVQNLGSLNVRLAVVSVKGGGVSQRRHSSQEEVQQARWHSLCGAPPHPVSQDSHMWEAVSILAPRPSAMPDAPCTSPDRKTSSALAARMGGRGGRCTACCSSLNDQQDTQQPCTCG